MSSDIKQRLDLINDKIVSAAEKSGRTGSDVTLITVTKTHPASVLQEVLDAGCLNIGENKVQEVVSKVPELTGEKVVHLIGHLQSNKVNKVVDLVDWIHSADSEKIIRKINNRCGEVGKKMNLLVQVNTSSEESKSGCDSSEVRSLCELINDLENVNLKGLMTIGPLYGGPKETRKSFIELRELKDSVKDLVDGKFELSMGMSGDFEMAIEEGATMVRVGSLILGQRSYN